MCVSYLAADYNPGDCLCINLNIISASMSAMAAISDALPLMIVMFSCSVSFFAVWVLNVVAPAPQGSRIIGMFFSFAVFPAISIDSICCGSKVPMFNSRALDIEVISDTSSFACAMTGAAPIARVTFAQSLTVT